MPSRRRVLAAAPLLATSGCSSLDVLAPDGDETGRTTDTADADRTPECQRGLVLHADDFAPTDQLLAPLSPPERDVVAAAVADDGTTVRTYFQAPVRDGVYVTNEDAFYRIDATETDESDVPAVELDVSWERGQQAPENAHVLAYSELPERDRHALDVAIYGSRYESGAHPTEGLERRSTPAPYPDGTDGSAFERGETVWVAWDDRTYELSVGGQTTVTRRTFDYRATEVATDDAGFREHIADRFLVALDDLDDEARSVLETAIEDDYRECEPPSEGFAALRDRLPADRELPPSNDRQWYARYDGERYRLRVFGWVV